MERRGQIQHPRSIDTSSRLPNIHVRSRNGDVRINPDVERSSQVTSDNTTAASITPVTTTTSIVVTVIMDDHAVTSLYGVRKSIIFETKNNSDIKSVLTSGWDGVINLESRSVTYLDVDTAWRSAVAMAEEVTTINENRSYPLPVRAILLTTINDHDIITSAKNQSVYLGTICKSLMLMGSYGYQRLMQNVVPNIASKAIPLDIVNNGNIVSLVRYLSRDQCVNNIFRTKIVTLYDGPYYIACYVISQDPDVYSDIFTARYAALECRTIENDRDLSSGRHYVVAVYENVQHVLRTLQLGSAVEKVAVNCGYDIVARKESTDLEGITYNTTMDMINTTVNDRGESNVRIMMTSDVYHRVMMHPDGVILKKYIPRTIMMNGTAVYNLEMITESLGMIGGKMASTPPIVIKTVTIGKVNVKSSRSPGSSRVYNTERIVEITPSELEEECDELESQSQSELESQSQSELESQSQSQSQSELQSQSVATMSSESEIRQPQEQHPTITTAVSSHSSTTSDMSTITNMILELSKRLSSMEEKLQSQNVSQNQNRSVDQDKFTPQSDSQITEESDDDVIIAERTILHPQDSQIYHNEVYHNETSHYVVSA